MLVSSPPFHIWFTFLNGFLFSPLTHQVENTLMVLIHQWDPKNLSHWPQGRDLGQMLTHFSDLRTISILMLHHQGLKGRHVGLLLFLGHWSGDRVRLWCKSSSQGGLSPTQRVHLRGLRPEKIRQQLSYTDVMNLVCPLLLSNSTLMALSPRSPPLGPFVQEQIPMTLPFTSAWLWITPGLHSENDSVALTIFKRMNVLFVLKNKAPSAKYKLDCLPTSSHLRCHHIQAVVKYTVTILQRQARWDKPGQKWELNSYCGFVSASEFVSASKFRLHSKTCPISPQKHEPAVVIHTLNPGLGSTWLSMSSRPAWYLVSSRPAELTLWDSVSKTDKWLILCMLRSKNLICESQQNKATTEIAPKALSSQAKQGRAEKHHHYQSFQRCYHKITYLVHK